MHASYLLTHAPGCALAGGCAGQARAGRDQRLQPGAERRLDAAARNEPAARPGAGKGFSCTLNISTSRWARSSQRLEFLVSCEGSLIEFALHAAGPGLCQQAAGQKLRGDAAARQACAHAVPAGEHLHVVLLQSRCLTNVEIQCQHCCVRSSRTGSHHSIDLALGRTGCNAVCASGEHYAGTDVQRTPVCAEDIATRRPGGLHRLVRTLKRFKNKCTRLIYPMLRRHLT